MAGKNPHSSVVAAAASDDRMTLLLALRARLAQVIEDGCSPRDLVGLSRRLLDVAQEIEDLRVSAESGKPHLRAVPDDDVFDPSSV